MYFIVAAGLGLVILVLAFVMLGNQADSQAMSRPKARRVKQKIAATDSRPPKIETATAALSTSTTPRPPRSSGPAPSGSSRARDGRTV